MTGGLDSGRFGGGSSRPSLSSSSVSITLLMGIVLFVVIGTYGCENVCQTSSAGAACDDVAAVCVGVGVRLRVPHLVLVMSSNSSGGVGLGGEAALDGAIC